MRVLVRRLGSKIASDHDHQFVGVYVFAKRTRDGFRRESFDIILEVGFEGHSSASMPQAREQRS